MGERVVSCLNDVRSNYDTDVFQPYFEAIRKACSTPEWECPAYSGKVGADDTEGLDMAYRVISDHIRTLTVSLSDGAIPSAKGRGSVLRLILRRACRYGRRFLRAPDGFFHKLVPMVVASLGEAFPGLKGNWEDVMALIAEEEAAFVKTVGSGEATFEKMVGKMTAEQKKAKMFPGADTFQLANTFGFPVELTEVMAKEKDLAVDMDGYNTLFKELQEKSRVRHEHTGKVIKLDAPETHNLQVTKMLLPTDDQSKYTWDSINQGGKAVAAKVLAIWDGKEFVDKASPETKEIGVVFDKTPAYALSGGQCADEATVTADGLSMHVSDVQTAAGYVVHIGKVEFGAIKVNSAVNIQVDYERRGHIARNHTCTHLMNWALREVLGEGADQQGSSVKAESFTFDFNCGNKISDEQLAKVEEIVNSYINRQETVYTEEIDTPDALEIGGIRAMFRERYGAKVRVVSCGQEVKAMVASPQEQRFRKFSVECCGGTHVSNMKEVYRFVILSDELVSRGVRRITACTGSMAASRAALRTAEIRHELTEAATLNGTLLESKITELRAKLQDDRDLGLLYKRKALHDVDDLKTKNLKETKGDAKKLLQTAKDLATNADLAVLKDGSPSLAVLVVSEINGDMKAVGAALEVLAKRLPDAAVCVLAPGADKIATVAQVPKALSTKVSAKALLEKAWSLSNGKGGGNDLKAQGTMGICEISKVVATIRGAVA